MPMQAAALVALEADACCDSAARAYAADNDDQKFLNIMCGWLMIVATLLVIMTFQAFMHLPGRMSLEFVPAFTPLHGSAEC
jgi:hypothetical protein